MCLKLGSCGLRHSPRPTLLPPTQPYQAAFSRVGGMPSSLFGVPFPCSIPCDFLFILKDSSNVPSFNPFPVMASQTSATPALPGSIGWGFRLLYSLLSFHICFFVCLFVFKLMYSMILKENNAILYNSLFTIICIVALLKPVFNKRVNV